MDTQKKNPDFNFNTVASIIFRPGAINDLANIVNSKKFKKIFCPPKHRKTPLKSCS